MVVVLWTEASTGPEGDFVREEAERGKRRGVLVPVRLDDVRIPLGFGELQTIDLIGWRGAADDAAFADLVGAIRARLAGAPPPPALAPAQRFARRMRRRIAAGVTLAVVTAFLLTAFKLQDRSCAVPFGQPWLGDACAAVGLGKVPSRRERLSWSALDLHDCQALRKHVKEFPSGAYEAMAKALLIGAHPEPGTRLESVKMPIVGYVRQSAEPFRARADAEADAVNRARFEARTECERVAAPNVLTSVDVQTSVDCRIDARGGVVCGSNYSATCHWENRLEVERC